MRRHRGLLLSWAGPSHGERSRTALLDTQADPSGAQTTSAATGLSSRPTFCTSTTIRSPSYAGDDGPLPPNAPGIRHILFVVDNVEASLAALRAHGGELVGELVNYEDIYWLCYVRGPAGIIVELAEKIG